ncbi:hypothetical protein ACJROX_10525 [Pseudalkalibacillus sp. A8]|uniref:hypothetical protein n=1 Tax=Pseudalkalibacillus sp. A8 TaxID=3382641 RepID=UPI0038B6476B
MIYYQFDPETDREILKFIHESGKLPDSLSNYLINQHIDMKENEEAFIFSNDDVETGFLWLTLSEGDRLEVTCLYIAEQSYSERFQKKLIGFAVKRAKYLGLPSVVLNIDGMYERTELTQLRDELGCMRLESNGHLIECILD